MNQYPNEQERQPISIQTWSIVIGSVFCTLCVVGSFWIPSATAFPLWGNVLGSVLFGALGLWWVRLNTRNPHLLDWMRDEEKFEAFACACMRWSLPLPVFFVDVIFWAITQPGLHTQLSLGARVAGMALFSAIFLLWWVLLLIFPQLEEKSLPDEAFIAGFCSIPALYAWVLWSVQWATICTILAAVSAACISIVLRRRRERREELRRSGLPAAGRCSTWVLLTPYGDVVGGNVVEPCIVPLCTCACRTPLFATRCFTGYKKCRALLSFLSELARLLALLSGELLDLFILLTMLSTHLVLLVSDLLLWVITGMCVGLGLVAASITETLLDHAFPTQDEWPMLVVCALGYSLVQGGWTLPPYQVLVLGIVLFSLLSSVPSHRRV